MGLNELIQGNYGKAEFYTEEEREMFGDESFNCCEKILRGGNRVYKLGLNSNGEHMSAPFGGGMGIGSVCGAVVGALMVLGAKCCSSIEKQSDVKNHSVAFLTAVESSMGSIYCNDLKPKYFIDEPLIRCDAVIKKVASLLDDSMEAINNGKEKEK